MDCTASSSGLLPPPSTQQTRFLHPRHAQSFKCPHCPQSVNTSQGLKSHITRKHPHVRETAPVAPSAPPPPPQSLPTTEGSLELILGGLRKSLKVIRRIPKGARIVAAAALTDAIDACLQDGSSSAWFRLLQFAPICFSVPDRREAKGFTLTTCVKQQIRAYQDGRFLQMKDIPAPSHLTTASSSSSSRIRCVQAKLGDGDVRGAVRLLCSEDTLATSSPATLEALQLQHPPCLPQEASHVLPDAQQLTALTVSESAVLGAITSFPAGSSGGLDFLRPQHLKDLTSKPVGVAGQRLLSSLTRLCNLMLWGGVPEDVCSVLYGASLCALSKVSGGIRPIAVGNTLRRLTAKLCTSHISSRLGGLLQPTQLGFGSKGGLEAATHSTRRYITFPHINTKVLLKVDFRNAFNLIHRDRILRTVSSTIPELYPFVNQCYSHPSSLVFGDHLIESARGVQQGDPLGPALFCLVLQPVISELQTELNIWYLDDGTLADDPDIVLHEFTDLVSKSAELGLELNPSKCELYCLTDDIDEQQAILASFQMVAPGIQLLLPINGCSQL